MMANLNKELVSTRKVSAAEKEKLLTEVNQYVQVLREQERSVGIMKSEFSLSKSNLESLNKELDYELGVKTTELKKLLVNHKEEMTAIKMQKEKDSMEFQRKFREKVLEF